MGPLMQKSDNQKGESPSFTIVSKHLKPKMGYVDNGTSYIVLKDDRPYKKPEKAPKRSSSVPTYVKGIILFFVGITIGFLLVGSIPLGFLRFICHSNSSVNSKDATSTPPQASSIISVEEFHASKMADKLADSLVEVASGESHSDLNDILDMNLPHMAVDIVMIVERQKDSNNQETDNQGNEVNNSMSLMDLIRGIDNIKPFNVAAVGLKQHVGNNNNNNMPKENVTTESTNFIVKDDRVKSGGEETTTQQKIVSKQLEVGDHSQKNTSHNQESISNNKIPITIATTTTTESVTDYDDRHGQATSSSAHFG